MLISDVQVEYALKCLQDWNGPKARAAAEYLDDLTKTLLSELGDEIDGSQAAKEGHARKHPTFRAHLIQKRDAAELDYKHRQRISASLAILDLYRTMCANERGTERLR